MKEAGRSKIRPPRRYVPPVSTTGPMTQRDVADADGLAWACVQAYAGLGEGAAAEAAAENADGETVTVVCTPTGTAQTVRLDLSADWETGLPDDDLVAAITAARAEQDAQRAET